MKNLLSMRTASVVRQKGFTLVELMVAMTISIFLLGGLFATVQSTRRAYADQSAMAQLQDNQRLAMSLMADVIENAGYFPDPTTNNAVTLMPSVAPFTASGAAGQPFAGTASAAAPGDTISVRFVAGPAPDNALNCIGGTNTTGANLTMVSQFSVLGGQLLCTFNGTAYPLISSGVLNMSLTYGLQRAPLNNGTCTDTYVTAAQMTTTDWNIVCSVVVTLTFDNPLKRPGVGAQTITLTRVIAVMAKAGVST